MTFLFGHSINYNRKQRDIKFQLDYQWALRITTTETDAIKQEWIRLLKKLLELISRLIKAEKSFGNYPCTLSLKSLMQMIIRSTSTHFSKRRLEIVRPIWVEIYGVWNCLFVKFKCYRIINVHIQICKKIFKLFDQITVFFFISTVVI